MLIEGILSSFVGAFVAAGAVAVLGYWINQYRQRTKVSVRIEVDTSIREPTIRVIAINDGRTPIVITELNVYIPAKEAFPKWPSPNPPAFAKQRLFRVRRMLRTPGSKNDAFAVWANECLSEGAIKSRLIPQRERIRIGANESCSMRLGESREPGQDKLLMVKTEAKSLTLVPSCQITGQKESIWGPPVIVGNAGDLLWAISPSLE